MNGQTGKFVGNLPMDWELTGSGLVFILLFLVNYIFYCQNDSIGGWNMKDKKYIKVFILFLVFLLFPSTILGMQYQKKDNCQGW